MPCAYKTLDGKRGCQFGAAEDELYSFDDKKWCEFHLPMENDKNEDSEKVQWDNKRSLDFSEKIYQIIKIAKNSGTLANFYGVVFPSYISFIESHNLPEISFKDAKFNGTNQSLIAPLWIRF